jgi:hypothetical protein
MWSESLLTISDKTRKKREEKSLQRRKKAFSGSPINQESSSKKAAKERILRPQADTTMSCRGERGNYG